MFLIDVRARQACVLYFLYNDISVDKIIKKTQNSCQLEIICKGLFHSCERFASVSTHMKKSKTSFLKWNFSRVFFYIYSHWMGLKKMLIWNQIGLFFYHAKIVFMQGPALRKVNFSTEESDVVSPNGQLALTWCSLRECIVHRARHQWVCLINGI